ncbi:hypothetical protein [Rhizobium sp. MHM7A]|uniref:hypothetical protein n=1 Tax=Rhizobium sp. MHM7A TaxID=2583233 RepID=UPI00110724F5|nr:hypothetical protein [Rhizobium sp. MHM7A]TLX15852.1 hypothetical protein FFR93_00625 [Rhizobium sp. MHM7A]
MTKTIGATSTNLFKFLELTSVVGIFLVVMMLLAFRLPEPFDPFGGINCLSVKRNLSVTLLPVSAIVLSAWVALHVGLVRRWRINVVVAILSFLIVPLLTSYVFATQPSMRVSQSVFCAISDAEY